MGGAGGWWGGLGEGRGRVGGGAGPGRRWKGGRSSVSAPLVSRELLNAHKDNLGTAIKFVIFNELSNARNPNNMQLLYTVLQHSSELAPKVGPPRCRPAAALGLDGWADGAGLCARRP